MPDVINDALAISQHVVQHLGVEAVQYLQGIEKLSIDDWREAYFTINAGSSDRTTKEAFIKAIAKYFVDDKSDTCYCVKNLSLLPGFQEEALQLYSYTASTLHAVQQATKSYADKCVSAARADLANFSTAPTASTLPSLSRIQQQGESPKTQPALYSDVIRERNAAAASGGKTNKGKGEREKKRQTQPWTFGQDDTRNTENQSEQFQYMCLAFKSGPDETQESLQAEVQRWKELEKLVVEPVSKSDYSTMFRVQFRTPVRLAEKWTAGATWPTRICVRPWRGDPKRKLKPVETREYQKKLYIGNLPSHMTLERMESHMHHVYEEELQKKTISKIEVFENEEGMKQQKQLQRDDPTRDIRKSVCVVLYSSPGGFTSAVSMKHNEYPQHIQKWIRPWRGPVPWPVGHKNRTILNLDWS